MDRLRDEYGNPVRQTDEYGNTGGRVQNQHSAGTIGTGTGTGTGHHGGSYDTGLGMGGGHQHQKSHDSGVTGKLHRSGSSSSSSSEDDGLGGRRKKGIKEKIKEKLPGGNKKDEYGSTTGHGPDPVGGRYTGYEQQEKQGIMEKVKDKLPGSHDQYGSTTGPGRHTGYEQTGHGPDPVGGRHTGYEQQEKQGIMEKVKDKLPGSHDQYGSTTGPGRHTGYEQTGHGPDQVGGRHTGYEQQEKQGIMEKVKDKLPGSHDQYGSTTGPGRHTGYEQTGHGPDPVGGRHTGYEQQEKQGIMDKIKDKLPGSH